MSQEALNRDSSFWISTLRSNWFIPLVLILLYPAAKICDNPNRLNPYYVRILLLIGINITLAVSLQLINGISGQFSLGHAGFMAVGAYLAGYPAVNYSDELHNPAGVLLFYIALAAAVAIIAIILWIIFALLRLTRRAHLALPLILLLVLVAWFTWDVAKSSTLPQTPPHLIWSKLIGRAHGLLDG